MAPLVPAFSDFSVLRQYPIHRADRAVVGSLVQKRGPHFGGRLVDKLLGVQGAEHLLSLGFAKGSVGPRATLRSGRHRPTTTIQRRTNDSQGLTRFRCLSNPSRQLLGRRHQSFSSLSGGFRGIPRSSEAFFLDLEHRLHPSEATLQSRVLAREFLDSRILDLAPFVPA